MFSANMLQYALACSPCLQTHFACWQEKPVTIKILFSEIQALDEPLTCIPLDEYLGGADVWCLCVRACSGQLQMDCTKSADGKTEQCFVAGQNTPQTCDPNPYGDAIKLPILMVHTLFITPAIIIIPHCPNVHHQEARK